VPPSAYSEVALSGWHIGEGVFRGRNSQLPPIKIFQIQITCFRDEEQRQRLHSMQLQRGQVIPFVKNIVTDE